MSDVCAVVVTYNPDSVKLAALLDAISRQVRHVVIVDNASKSPIQANGAVLLQNVGNVGLAAALNQGIAWGLSAGADYILTLDQDSSPGPDMVRLLLHDAQRIDQPVAAVGPSLEDPRSGRAYPFVKFGFPNNTQMVITDLTECDFLITSGCLTPAASFQTIGLMNETLFIDNVDMEWCFRAKAKGFGIYGSASAKMAHEIGDALISVPVLKRKRILVHGPVRLYYIMRNRVLLYWMPHVTRQWVAQDLLRIPFKFGIFALLVPGQWSNIKHMVLGLWHGIRGVTGAYPTPR